MIAWYPTGRLVIVYDMAGFRTTLYRYELFDASLAEHILSIVCSILLNILVFEVPEETQYLFKSMAVNRTGTVR